MTTLAVVILTYNEELNLERALRSVDGVAHRVFVIDSFSTDRTVEIAKKCGAVVLQNKWANHAVQFQWALDNCTIDSEWIMKLDADESFDQEFRESILGVLDKAPDEVTGYSCKLWNYFLGKQIRFGGYDPLTLLRVFRKGVGSIEPRWMDEHITLSYGCAKMMPGKIIHNNQNNNSWWISKHNGYASKEMLEVLSQKYGFIDSTRHVDKTNLSARGKRIIKEKVYNKLPLFVRPALYFTYRYIFRLGFWDGKIGFAYHFLHAFWYRVLVDVRILEAELMIKKGGGGKENARAVIKELTGIDI